MVVRRTIVSKGLGAGVVLVALAYFVLAAVEMYQALWNAPQLKRDRELVSHTFEVMSAAKELEWAVRDAERGQRNYLITGDAPHLSTIIDSRRVGLYKPDPAIFIHAAAMLELRTAIPTPYGERMDEHLT